MAEKEYIEAKDLDDFRNEIVEKFLSLCDYNDYKKLTLLRICETIDKAYETYVSKPLADVVELPLKIGDVVYASISWEDNGAFLPYQITCLTITQNKKKEWRKNYRAHRLINGKTIDSYVSFSFDEIGKEVFLTIEEAERKGATP